MTPAALSSSKGDSAAGATDTHATLLQTDRHRRQSGADALYAISEAVHSMSVPHPSTSGPSILPPHLLNTSLGH